MANFLSSYCYQPTLVSVVKVFFTSITFKGIRQILIALLLGTIKEMIHSPLPLCASTLLRIVQITLFFLNVFELKRWFLSVSASKLKKCLMFSTCHLLFCYMIGSTLMMSQAGRTVLKPLSFTIYLEIVL